MGVTELLQSVQFVVDHEGKRKAVQVDLETWEELLDLLEDLDTVCVREIIVSFLKLTILLRPLSSIA
jgi:hypothetical protein